MNTANLDPDLPSNNNVDHLDNRQLSGKVEGMDLDLAHVRAFVCAAEELHFGRAAARLFLTQQAVSKRIARLEATLGEPLFLRHHQAVELTPAGERFLPHARSLLAAAVVAVQAAHARPTPLRIDVWGPVHLPLRILRGMADSFVFELSMRRSLGAALEAVVRGELDVAFGRPHDLGRLPEGLNRRLLFLEPIAAGVISGHRFAGLAELTADELRETGLWLPFEDNPPELVGLLRAYAAHLGVQVQSSPLNLGVEHTLEDLGRHPERVTPLGALWTLPAQPEVVRIPLRPTPYLPWSVLWRADNRHPLLPSLLDRLVQAAEGWCDFNPARDWLPDPDLADLKPS